VTKGRSGGGYAVEDQYGDGKGSQGRNDAEHQAAENRSEDCFEAADHRQEMRFPRPSSAAVPMKKMMMWLNSKRHHAEGEGGDDQPGD